MAEWLWSKVNFILALFWENQTEFFIGVGVFIFATLLGMALVGLLLVKMPANYFCYSRPRDLWIDQHPAVRWTGLILKNVTGGLLVAFGVLLTMPGVPGPGLLTILIGVTLIDFPGKRRFERWLVHLPKMLTTINRLRARYGKPPLLFDDPPA